MVSPRLMLLAWAINVYSASGFRKSPNQNSSEVATSLENNEFKDARAMLPDECDEVVGEERGQYTFGPEFAFVGNMQITAWGGKSDSQKGQDRELHICKSSIHRCIFAIMDGHGGPPHLGGAVIAQRAKKDICDRMHRMTDEDTTKKALAEVITSVNLMTEASSSGSTLSGVVILDSSAIVFHAGDSPTVWAGDDLKAGPIGQTANHDCHNENEMQRIRDFRSNQSALNPFDASRSWSSWNPCHYQRGWRMRETGTMVTRGMGDKYGLTKGFSNEPQVQMISLSRGKAGVRWFLLSSDGILADQSLAMSMQLAYSTTELLKVVALGIEEEKTGESGGVRARLEEMMKVGNGFQLEEMPEALRKSPLVQVEFPLGSGKMAWKLRPEIIELLPALPDGTGDDNHWRPTKQDGKTKVAHGNGDDCSVLVVRLDRI